MPESITTGLNRVETPFIIVQIGDYTFGNSSDMSSLQKLKTLMNVTYPNFMNSLNIVKINGSINTYTLKMDYAITQVDDPNLLEKVFSSVSKSRNIKLSYGDWNMPQYIYKEEEAIITKISSNVDFANSKITYTLNCVSSALSLKAGSFAFPAQKVKPSDELKRILNNESYGLSKIFSGMRNASKNALSGFIASDDKSVQLEEHKSINVLDYMSYLVGCMECQNETGNGLNKSKYALAIYDDTTNEYGGTYFKVVRVDSTPNNSIISAYSTYEVDVGYPSNTYVMNFTVNTDNTWSILYDYSSAIKQPEYRYSINKDGEIVATQSPILTTSSQHLKTTQADKSWWSQMTQFPITAKITIRGLLRPAILMSYLKVNTYFYGHKHISSGIYIITRQEDTIDANGYRTTLSLTRIGGDS